RQLLIDLYDAEIRYNDEHLGAFFDALRDRDLLENSIVIVSADHGDAFGEHGYYEHPRYLHEEITHVPLFVRPPGGLSDTVEAPVSTLDVVATIEGIVGRERELSLLGSQDADRRVFSQARGENDHSALRRYAVRTQTDACLCERDVDTGAIEFTHSTDPSLRSELEAHVDERVRVENGEEPAGDGTAVDADIERRLSALGYKE
ncbi:MAG: sulfatase-like hydrolase/transferase, partial [Haloferacaceae archaeon]